MTPSLDDLLDLAERQARIILLEKGEKQLMPIFLLVNSQNEVAFIHCPWDGELDKQIMIAAVRQKAHDMHAVALSHLSEAWLSKQKPGDPYIQPSKSPDRKEVVIIMATDGITNKARTFDIERNWKGKICALTREEHSVGDKFAGRMIDDILPVGGHA